MSDGIDEEEEFVTLTRDYVRQRIIHVLRIYPKISMSMLQVGIGTAITPKFWRPVLADMEKEGTVSVNTVSSVTPSGRDQSYRIVSLNH